MRPQTTAVKHLATRAVITVQAGASLTQCAQVMRNEHVGSVVVVDARSGAPLGIVTDRDLVVESIAVKVDPATLTAADVMATPLAVVREDDDLLDALAKMREYGARRLPVLDASGRLAGIVALDNLIEALAEQLDAVVGVIKAGRTKEAATRS
jgi:CBS domain-containing protein